MSDRWTKLHRRSPSSSGFPLRLIRHIPLAILLPNTLTGFRHEPTKSERCDVTVSQSNSPDGRDENRLICHSSSALKAWRWEGHIPPEDQAHPHFRVQDGYLAPAFQPP